jgi:hypothetical protein
LPRFVTLPARQPQHPRTRALDVAWHPDLAWAATQHIHHDHRRFLEQVNLFLAKGGADRKVVPLRERSLELCGDEKHLERLLGTALFAPGRLTRELLRVERVFDPFAITRIGAGSLLLVVENATTYRTLCRHLSREGNTAVVGFGGGWQLPARIGFAADLDPPVPGSATSVTRPRRPAHPPQSRCAGPHARPPAGSSGGRALSSPAPTRQAEPEANPGRVIQRCP